MTIIETITLINKANLSDLIMFAKKGNLEKGSEFLVGYHKEIMTRLKSYLAMKLKNKRIQSKIKESLDYLTGLEFYRRQKIEIRYGDVFIYTNFEGKKEIHFIRNLLEDSEGKMVIAEDGKDYGYIGENDKVFYIGS